MDQDDFVTVLGVLRYANEQIDRVYEQIGSPDISAGTLAIATYYSLSAMLQAERLLWEEIRQLQRKLDKTGE